MSDKRDLSVKRISNKNLIKADNIGTVRSSSVSSAGVGSGSGSGSAGGSPIRTSKTAALTSRSQSVGDSAGGGGGGGAVASYSSLHLRNVSVNAPYNNKAAITTVATATTTATATATTIAITDVKTLPIKAASSRITRTSTALADATASVSTFTALNESPNDKPFAIYFMVNFQYVCIFTAILPLVTLFTCFITAYVFQYDEVHETHCRVYNIVPSISAITGVSPQRYFWRFSIAMHLGPRVPIAFIYKNYYHHMLAKMTRLQYHQAINANLLIKSILILNCIEIASLGGVTYISNRENYPIHEKIFIIFMICSLCYMLATIKLNDILHKDSTILTQQQRDSIKWKKILFALSIVSTIGLLVFFAKHRFYCHDLAFSWFAFFEYLIAIANMLFHFTVVWDFPTQYMMVVQAPYKQLNDLFSNSVSSSSGISTSTSTIAASSSCSSSSSVKISTKIPKPLEKTD